MKIKHSVLTAISILAFSSSHADTNSSATSGMILQGIGAAANATQGVIYTGECLSPSPNKGSCVLATLSYAQAAMLIANALKSSKTRDSSQCTGAYCSEGNLQTPNPITGPGANPPGDVGTLNPEILEDIQDQVNAGLSRLGGQGYSFDASTNSVKTPSGSVSASSLSTPDGLKDKLGMTDADLLKMKGIGARALADAQKKFGDYENFGGGKKAKAGAGYGKDNFDMNSYMALLNKPNAARGVAGLEKKYGSDKIGVAQENIFDIIHRQYNFQKPSLQP